MHHIFVCHIFCHIFTYSNEKNTLSHLQSTKQSSMLISEPEKCNCRKSDTCKHKSCLKIEQFCIKNNVLLEASCKYYCVKRRYNTCQKAQLKFAARWCCVKCAKIHAGLPGLLLLITNELLCHVFELCEQELVLSSHIVCCKASDLCCNFMGKAERARANVIFR